MAKTKTNIQKDIAMYSADFSKHDFTLSEYVDFINRHFAKQVTVSIDNDFGVKTVVDVDKHIRQIDFCDSVLLKFVDQIEQMNADQFNLYKEVLAYTSKISKSISKCFSANFRNEKFLQSVKCYEKGVSAASEYLKATNALSCIKRWNSMGDDYVFDGRDKKYYEDMLKKAKLDIVKYPVNPANKLNFLKHESMKKQDWRLKAYTSNIKAVSSRVKSVEEKVEARQK